MLSVQRVKEILKDENISEEEAEEIRDSFHLLAEFIFDKWQKEKGLAPPLNKSDKLRYDKGINPPAKK